MHSYRKLFLFCGLSLLAALPAAIRAARDAGATAAGA